MARSSRIAALLFCLALALPACASTPNSPTLLEVRHGDDDEHSGSGMRMHHPSSDLAPQTGSAPMNHSAMSHSHHHADPPKLMLEPDLLTTEESYWDYDSTPQGHAGLMSAHIALMTVAWGALLPLGIMFRAAHHPLFFPLQLLFIGLNALAVLFARTYNAMTPDHYPHDSHSRMGYMFLIYAGAVMSVDLLKAARSLTEWFKIDRQPGKLAAALLGKGLEGEQVDYEPLQEQLDSAEEEGDWVNNGTRPFPASRRNTSESNGSDDTLHDDEGNISYQPGLHSPSTAKPMQPLQVVTDFTRQKRSKVAVFFKYLHIFAVRLLVFFGWTELLTGIIAYTGVCAGNYINGCLAHYIKGSVFIWYGVITFGRYLGAWSELGWAWNKKPTSGWRSRMPTPEMVEVGHILFYGTTNTFMERFGVSPGEPFTIHELEHISIAIMFFGTGLLGVLLELKSVRRLISNKAHSPEGSKSTPTHGWSWNIAPALTIALTGMVMSKHHQEYAFAVDVHALWGNLLFLFGVFRLITYLFLWLRPPTVSSLPSRPPSEALASFCLIAAGVLFICSSEEIVFAAMRAEIADVMIFLNLTTTFVTLFMAWIVALLAIKGWAFRRMQGAYQRATQGEVNLS